MQATRYWISGQLRSIKRGAMVVQAGKSKVRAEVNESTRVVVETKDLRMARPGDTVVVNGSAYGPGQAEADTIEVTLAERRADEPTGKERGFGKKPADARRGARDER